MIKELMIHLLNNPTPVIPASTRKDDISDDFYLEEVNPIWNIRIKLNNFLARRSDTLTTRVEVKATLFSFVGKADMK